MFGYPRTNTYASCLLTDWFRVYFDVVGLQTRVFPADTAVTSKGRVYRKSEPNREQAGRTGTEAPSLRGWDGVCSDSLRPARLCIFNYKQELQWTVESTVSSPRFLGKGGITLIYKSRDVCWLVKSFKDIEPRALGWA